MFNWVWLFVLLAGVFNAAAWACYFAFLGIFGRAFYFSYSFGGRASLHPNRLSLLLISVFLMVAAVSLAQMALAVVERVHG